MAKNIAKRIAAALLRTAHRTLHVVFVDLHSPVIGDFLITVDYFLSQKALKKNQTARPIFFHSSIECNHYLLNLVRNRLPIAPTWAYPFLRRIHSFCINSGLTKLYFHTHWLIRNGSELAEVQAQTGPHLSISIEDVDDCEIVLRRLGIPAGGKFFCFFARDSSYKNWLRKENLSAYGNKSDEPHSYRNTDIAKMESGVIDIIELTGLYAIRMGKVVEKPVPFHHPKVIDYSFSNEQSERMDIFLGSRCEFFTSTNSGIDCVPMIFRRPVFRTNLVPLGVIGVGIFENFIPKKLLDRNGKYISLQGIFDRKLDQTYHTEGYTEQAVTVVENDMEEIAEFMRGAYFERCHGGSIPEHIALREKFNDIMKRNGVQVPARTKICPYFLKRNPWFLDS